MSLLDITLVRILFTVFDAHMGRTYFVHPMLCNAWVAKGRCFLLAYRAQFGPTKGAAWPVFAASFVLPKAVWPDSQLACMQFELENCA